MNRILIFLTIIALAAGCSNPNGRNKRIVVARAGDEVLYMDQINHLLLPGMNHSDSVAIVRDYISKWARKELMYQKAMENLTPELKAEIDSQIEEARLNLTVYQYQRQMMLERMDTVINDEEMENYYQTNNKSFFLSSNILKALFIKVPFETPNIARIRFLARSKDQTNLQELETICYQFAEKLDDFEEKWVTLDRISTELPQEISNEEYFLRRSSYHEFTDSVDVYMVAIRDYRLRSTLAPFDYVKDDIKRIIWNSRRLEFIRDLENGIYNSAIQEGRLKTFNY